MSRIYDTPISVIARAGQPHRLLWRDEWHAVTAIHDSWVEAGEWWRGETRREVWVVETDGGLVREVARNARGEWRMFRVFD